MDQSFTPAALTVAETAAYLRISRTTVYELFNSGDLTPAKVGGRTLVRRTEADELLKRSAKPKRQPTAANVFD